MKRTLTLSTVFLLLTVSVYAQSLTQADRDRALQYLESTKQGVLQATSGLALEPPSIAPPSPL
jgi:hypothetical protein